VATTTAAERVAFSFGGKVGVLVRGGEAMFGGGGGTRRGGLATPAAAAGGGIAAAPLAAAPPGQRHCGTAALLLPPPPPPTTPAPSRHGRRAPRCGGDDGGDGLRWRGRRRRQGEVAAPAARDRGAQFAARGRCASCVASTWGGGTYPWSAAVHAVENDVAVVVWMGGCAWPPVAAAARACGSGGDGGGGGCAAPVTRALYALD